MPLDGIYVRIPTIRCKDALGVVGVPRHRVLGHHVLRCRRWAVTFSNTNNFIPADPLKTPPHIAPVWYFTPYYSILRATTAAVQRRSDDHRRGGDGRCGALVLFLRSRALDSGSCRSRSIAAVAMILLRTFDAKFKSVVIMGGFRWSCCSSCRGSTASPVKAIRYRPDWHKWLYALFIVAFVVARLTPTRCRRSAAKNIISQIGTAYYFAFFVADADLVFDARRPANRSPSASPSRPIEHRP